MFTDIISVKEISSQIISLGIFLIRQFFHEWKSYFTILKFIKSHSNSFWKIEHFIGYVVWFIDLSTYCNWSGPIQLFNVWPSATGHCWIRHLCWKMVEDIFWMLVLQHITITIFSSGKERTREREKQREREREREREQCLMIYGEREQSKIISIRSGKPICTPPPRLSELPPLLPLNQLQRRFDQKQPFLVPSRKAVHRFLFLHPPPPGRQSHRER